MHAIFSILHSIRYFIYALLAFLLIAFVFLFVGPSKPAEKMEWGTNFSQKHAEGLGLDWRETYLAVLDDLGAKRVKIAAHWDMMEPSQFIYKFDDMDWMLDEAQKRGVKVVPVVGMKTPRWPECHVPEWARKFDRGSQEHQIRKYVEAFVQRYKTHPAVDYWQIENEPFFNFGACPWQPNGNFLRGEVAMVRQLDPDHKIMITDSGEFSLWWEAAKIGDKVGSTMYRIVWATEFGWYAKYPFPPVFYDRRAWMLDKFFGKEAINSELQAEPWAPQPYHLVPVEEQFKSMSFEQFKKNIEFARRTGLTEAYFWGAEWWYWMKTKQNHPEFWEEAKNVMREA